MIVGGAGTIVVSNLGWVDQGRIWVFDAATGTARLTTSRGARHVSLVEGDGARFVAVHHFGGERVLVTVQTFEAPDTALAELEVGARRAVAAGSPDAWQGLPTAFVGYLDASATGPAGYHLIRTGHDPEVARLAWFDAEIYDLGYQAVTSVVEVPATGELLFGIARSSDLVRSSPDGSTLLGYVRLPDRGGNPVPHVRRTGREVWAVNYDTLVRLDASMLQVNGNVDLAGGHGFIGDLSWSADDRVVAVGRPFRGDVVLVDGGDLRIRRTISTGREPLDAAALPSGGVVARDWSTGELLVGGLPERRSEFSHS